MKNYSILLNKLFLIVFFTSNLFSLSIVDKGNEHFLNKKYKKALFYYEQTDDKTQLKIKFRITQSYLRVGDKYHKIKDYDSALVWYKKAAKLNDKSAFIKMGKVYEKKADKYTKIHKYKKALELYKRALKLKNKALEKKIEHVKQKLSHKKKLEKDTRKIVNKNSPQWTKSIGKLIIPTKLEFIGKTKYITTTKKCSATLVSLNENTGSATIITAAHCLSSHNKKAGPMQFIIKNKKQKMVNRVANIEFKSQFHIKNLKTTTDFAILSLNRKISYTQVKPMIIRKDSFSDLQKKYKYSFGSLGGFSNDIAAYGAKLTYDPKCKLSPYSRMYAASTCKGFKGSSGGPIILTTTKDNIIYKHHFVGVVSHFKNKDFTNIFFAPHHLFYYKIKNSIQN